MITKENKTVYKLKNVSFDGMGHLVDENSDIIDLVSNLSAIFKDECFDMSFTSSSKDELNIEDLKDNSAE